MKKITLLITALILSMGLMACGTPPDGGKEPEAETPEVTEPETPEVNEGENPGETEEDEDEEAYSAPEVPEVTGERADTNITQEDLKSLYSENQEMLEISSYFLGMKAPDILMTSLSGSETSLSEISSENTIVEFMASWCGVCQSAKPGVEEYKSKEGSARLISVAMFDDSESLKKFAGEDADDYFEPADENKTAEEYLLRFVPIFFFIDGDGIIQFVYSGEVTADTLNQYAEKAFGTTIEN